MNKDKARKFIEEQMPNFKVVPSETDGESTNNLASADAADADVNSLSINAWNKAAPTRNSSINKQIDELRSQFRPRKLEGASARDSSSKQPEVAPSADGVELQGLSSGKTEIVPVVPKNTPDDSSIEPQDMVVDEDEGIIGASS